MKASFIFLQATLPNIEQKINEAPDQSYSVGVLIGSFLPVIFLAIIAYGIYYYNKNKK